MSSLELPEIVYARFAELWANSLPIRGEEDLDAAVHAAGLDYDEIDDGWLRSLSPRWVHFQTDEPFRDEIANREYRRLIST
jgi:hypothetical protein